jgi:hemolysin-activating ACP:hemolysin acyltransferase
MSEANETEESLWMRLLHVVIIWVMLSIAQTILVALTVVQFIMMLTRKGRPNVEIAWFGKRLGDWQAKATRYQTAADEEKPWPWTPFE